MGRICGEVQCYIGTLTDNFFGPFSRAFSGLLGPHFQPKQATNMARTKTARPDPKNPYFERRSTSKDMQPSHYLPDGAPQYDAPHGVIRYKAAWDNATEEQRVAICERNNLPYNGRTSWASFRALVPVNDAANERVMKALDRALGQGAKFQRYQKAVAMHESNPAKYLQ